MKFYSYKLARCASDPIYFMENFVFINSNNKDKILLKLYDYQKDLITKFTKNQYNLVVKSRQLGISTISLAYALWYILFHSNKRVCFVILNGSMRKDFMKILRNMYNSLPSWIKDRNSIEYDTIRYLTLSNKSTISFDCSVSDMKCVVPSLLIFDEASYNSEIEHIVDAFSAISYQCIAYSNFYPVDNWFTKECKKIYSNQSEFLLTKLDWRVHPERDKEWFKKQAEYLIPEQFVEEYECNINLGEQK